MVLSAPVKGGLVRTGKYGIRAKVPIGGGKFSDPSHPGVDIRAAVGTPVYPVEGGVVVQTRAGWRSRASVGLTAGSRIFTDPGAGNLVVVRGPVKDTIYCHLSAVGVRVGDTVGVGTLLGKSGVTGVAQPHLHLGIWARKVDAGKTRWVPVDPTPLLPWTDDKFKELAIGNNEEDDEMNDADRTWFNKALGDTEKRIREDLKKNVVDEVAKASKAAQEASDALIKPIFGFKPIDVIRTHVVANKAILDTVLEGVKAQAKSQGVDLDEGALAERLVAQGLPEAIVLEMVKQTQKK